MTIHSKCTNPIKLSKAAIIICLTWLFVGSLGFSQTTVSLKNDKKQTEKEDTESLVDKSKEQTKTLAHYQASIHTRKNARTMTLFIPAPRGQIVDRFGYSFAQTIVVWYPALQMKQFTDESDDFILSWSRKRIAQANELFGMNIRISDATLIDHYRNRRWLPMPFKHVVSKAQKDNLIKSGKLMDGLILHPIYQRYYPQHSCAAHIIGYVGNKSRNLEKGPINYGDPLFWPLEGRGGLERFFNKQLTGTAGKLKLQYDSNGNEVRRDEVPPKPGGTVVTTLDLKWQKRAERILREHCKRGAFVIIDVETGEVLVMASRPSYDLNLWVPFMKPEDYNKLLNAKNKPLYARAFQGSYPPASCFKVVTDLAALDCGAITKDTTFECPAYIKLGNHKFYDWSRRHRGRLKINRGIAYSNNPFHILTALACERKRPGHFMTIAARLGYGARTGLPLDGEYRGNLLSEEYTLKHYGRKITLGDIANAAIGQGAILASPLQVAQCMAGIANGGVLPQLALIKQVQNDRGVIISATKPHNKNTPKIDAEAIRVVKKGMYSVVNEPYGTGKRGALSYTVLCGKTGTAQWGAKSKEQGLAWFAGFFPMDKPKYAFAALYEGSPHEKVGGGRLAAPMVSSFFEGLKEETLNRHATSKKALIIPDEVPDDIDNNKSAPTEPGKALIVEDDSTKKTDIPLAPPKALIVEDDPEETPPPAENPPANPTEPSAPKSEVPPLPDLPAGVKPPTPATPDPAQKKQEPPKPQDPPKKPKPPKALIVE